MEEDEGNKEEKKREYVRKKEEREEKKVFSLGWVGLLERERIVDYGNEQCNYYFNGSLKEC